jgi:Domain of unknown function (DUF4328)/Protein of unknown function (DUF2510)
VSEHDGYPGAPPGWYPDPAGGPGQRWWDGYAWTEATVLPQPPPPPPWADAPPAPPVGQPHVAPAVQPQFAPPWAEAAQRLSAFNAGELVEAELRMVPVGRVAVAMPALCNLASVVITRLYANRYLAAGNQFRIDWHDAQLHKTAPPYSGPSIVTPASLVVNLVFIVAAILALVWQHRAASAGRALGIPSDQSPAWGVGSWFVPVVSYWIPYQAVRNCLPPGDPHRPRVLHWWIAWVVSISLGLAFSITSLFSSGAALALAIPLALADLAVVAWAPGIVNAIASSHRAALAQRAQATGVLSG